MPHFFKEALGCLVEESGGEDVADEGAFGEDAGHAVLGGPAGFGVEDVAVVFAVDVNEGGCLAGGGVGGVIELKGKERGIGFRVVNADLPGVAGGVEGEDGAAAGVDDGGGDAFLPHDGNELVCGVGFDEGAGDDFLFFADADAVAADFDLPVVDFFAGGGDFFRGGLAIGAVFVEAPQAN